VSYHCLGLLFGCQQRRGLRRIVARRSLVEARDMVAERRMFFAMSPARTGIARFSSASLALFRTEKSPWWELDRFVAYVLQDPLPNHTAVMGSQVGVAVAFSIVNQGMCSEMALVDVDHDKVVGEALDLAHGAAFTKHVAVRGSSSYEVSAGSHVVVLTAGVRQRPGETRLALVGRNLAILQSE
jgi:hypothetical protein